MVNLELIRENCLREQRKLFKNLEDPNIDGKEAMRVLDAIRACEVVYLEYRDNPNIMEKLSW